MDQLTGQQRRAAEKAARKEAQRQAAVARHNPAPEPATPGAAPGLAGTLLERSTAEAYSSIFVGILGAIVTPWWAKGALLVIALSLAVDYIFRSKRTHKWRPSIKIAASAAVAVLLVAVAWDPIITEFEKIHKGNESEAVTISSLANGAFPAFQVMPAQTMTDGAIVFPLSVINQGDSEMLNYSYHFAQFVTATMMTRQEQISFFDDSTAKQYYPQINKISDSQLHQNIIENKLPSGTGFILTQPNERFTSQQVAEILAGRLFAYNAVIVRYTDAQSMQKGRYYYAEYCARFIPGQNAVTPCPAHNFLKNPGR